MSVILFSLLAAAAAASLGGALAARRISSRRKAKARLAEPDTGSADNSANTAHPRPVPVDRPALAVGDVIQHDMTTRWPQGALVCRDHRGVQLTILLSEEAGIAQATVAFAAPERSIMWLEASELSMPGKPPSRIELDGALLDRQLQLALTIETLGNAPAELAGDAVVAAYRGSVGDAALLFDHPSGTRLWRGQRLEEGDYERLANVPADPDAADG